MNKRNLEKKRMKYNIISKIYSIICIISFLFLIGIVGRMETDNSFSSLTGAIWMGIACIILVFSFSRFTVFNDTKNKIQKRLNL